MRKAMLVFVILISASSAFAQQPATPTAGPAPPQLTWLRFYSVDRVRTTDFMDAFNASTATVLDRLVADRQVVSWGMAIPFTRTGADWTHLLWITVNNWAAGDVVVRALEESDRTRPATDVQRDQQTLLSTVHSSHDVVLRHVQQSTTPPGANFKPMYIRAAFYTFKPGRSDDALAIFREYTLPLYTDLGSQGVMGPWGMSVQDVVTDPSFTHVIWYFLDSLQRLDQIREAGMARPADARAAMGVKVRDASESEKSRSEILRIVHVNIAAPPAPR